MTDPSNQPGAGGASTGGNTGASALVGQPLPLPEGMTRAEQPQKRPAAIGMTASSPRHTLYERGLQLSWSSSLSWRRWCYRSSGSACVSPAAVLALALVPAPDVRAHHRPARRQRLHALLVSAAGQRDR